MDYLLELDLSKEEIDELTKTLKPNEIESIQLFPGIVKANYTILKNVGIKNYKDIFLKHSHMFLQNPNKFQAIFDKYDHNDLIRCLEKNGSIIEKL